ncbi:MAG: 5'-nucleotidase C-terminal domain-containing protein [Myxococcota bacterium]
MGRFWIGSVLVLALGCGTPSTLVRDPEPAETPPERVQITIVGTNDHHGHIQWLPLLGGHLRNLRADVESQGGGVLLIDGGDLFQGTLQSNMVEGASVIRGYNLLGYHAATVGNHEFDFGPVGDAVVPEADDDDPRGALFARAAEAEFPFLAANLLDRESGEPVRWDPIRPTARVEVAGGVPVGIIGVTAENTLVTTIAGNVADLAMAPVAEAIRTHAGALRDAGAKIVVVAAHAGGKCHDFENPRDLTSCEPEEIFEVAEALPEGTVDAIVAGHTHQGVAHFVNGIPIIESFAYGVAFGRIDLTYDRTLARVVETEIHPPYFMCGDGETELADCTPREYAGATVIADPRVGSVVGEDLARADALQSRELGVTLTESFVAARAEASALGNLVADMVREARDGDVGLMNGGGLRASLPSGPLTYGAFYTMFPFDNRFAIAEVRGIELKALVEENLRNGDGIYSFSGITIQASCGPAGGYLVELRRDNGRPIADDETLRLVLSDYLATGASPILTAIRSDGRTEVESGEPIRETLVRMLEARGGELRPSDYHDAEAPRFRFPSRPLSCR